MLLQLASKKKTTVRGSLGRRLSLSPTTAYVTAAQNVMKKHPVLFHCLSPNPAVLCTVLAAGLWLAVAETLPTSNVKCFEDNTKVGVHFGYAYYILLVGGLFSLGGAAFNLLFAKSAAERRRALRLRFR